MKTQANKCFFSFVNPRFYTDSQDHFSIGHESRGDGEWRKLWEGMWGGYGQSV